jgi:hypothetical protein
MGLLEDVSNMTFARDFHMTVLCFGRVVKCISGPQKIILDTLLFRDVMHLFPGHHVHLT